MRKPYTASHEPATRWILHGDADVRSVASKVWGVGFAGQSCRALERGGRATLWLGPDEFMLRDARAPGDGEFLALEQALAHLPHALVDVSERQLGFEVAGRDAASILNGACPLDLDLREFPVHMCTRTVFAKAEILLWRREAMRFHVEVWRSFAPYFVALLEEIASAS